MPPSTLTLLRLTLAGAVLSGLGSGALFLKSNRDLRGTLSGLPDPTLAPRPAILAVNADLAGGGDPQGTAAAVRAAGFGWLRQPFRWAELEPQPGDLRWAAADALVEAASAHSLQLIAVLLAAPAWSHPGNPHPTAPPDDPAALARFAAAFAARYGARVEVYQVWDEPNLTSGWGDRDPSPAGYAALLQAAHRAIHAADPDATVLAAGLAPTTETGPANLSDLLFLDELYRLGAAAYFDGASGKPYGFNVPPDDRRADPALLNFSRFVLLREVMERHGDQSKLLWAANFGWNALPAGWSGAPSIWGQVSETQQAAYTAAAYRRAAREWPWAGPMALETWTPVAQEGESARQGAAGAADEARWGFALLTPPGQPRPALTAVTALAETLIGYAQPGNHAAQNPAAEYAGGWLFSELGADIPQHYAGARLTFHFQGSELGLRVRRADYRGYLYVTVDGAPADALPRDERGAYLVLTSPDLSPRLETLPLATGLAPGPHTAQIVPERGWAQWAIAGFSVGNRPPGAARRLAWALAALAASSLAAAIRSGAGVLASRSAPGDRPLAALLARWRRASDAAQLTLAAALSLLLYLSAALSLGGAVAAFTRKGGDALPLLLTALTAGVFYYSPWLLLAGLALVALLLLFCLRLELAFPLIAFFAPFYLQPRPLFDRAFSMVEILTLLAAAAWLARSGAALAHRKKEQGAPAHPFPPPSSLLPASSPDLPMLALVAVAAASTLTAEIKGVALRELRVAILEPALFYLLLRANPLRKRDLLRIVDFWLLGAVLVAGVGLYQYFTGANLITAEGGLQRLRSVYGSPNNVGLYLGRVVGPIAAMLLIGRDPRRRWPYALAGLPVAAALVLSFSKGALLLGVPAALALVLLLWGGRRARWALGAAIAAGLAALVPLSRLPRFAGLLDPGGGTSFFRFKLWQSALAMIRDHPLLGVGPDNFLYAYRGRYILPQAWQDPNLSHPHNWILDYAARLGVPGLAAGLWLQVAFWGSAARALRRLTDPDLRALSVGLMASMANFLAHGMVDNAHFLVDLSFVFALTVGMVARLGTPGEAQPCRRS